MNKKLYIDGDKLQYNIVNAEDYLIGKEYSSDFIFDSYKNGCADLISKIIGIQYGCYFLENTHSMMLNYTELIDNLNILKQSLINDLKEKYNLIYDENFLSDYYVEYK